MLILHYYWTSHIIYKLRTMRVYLFENCGLAVGDFEVLKGHLLMTLVLAST